MRFSFDDLKAEKNETAHWDGVRNYSARNFMREMKVCNLNIVPSQFLAIKWSMHERDHINLSTLQLWI